MNKPMSWFEEKNYVTMRNRFYTRHRWPDKEKSPTDFKFGRSFIVTNNGSKVTNNGSKVTNNGSKVTNNGSKVTNNGSKVTINGSKVTNNGSKVKELMVPAGEAWMYDTVDGHV